MAVDQANIVKAQLLKNGCRRHHAFHVFFGAAHKILGLGQGAQGFFAALPQIGIELAGPEFGKVGGQTAGIARDGHLVVVQHHQKIFIHMGGMINRLKGHTGGHGAIAHHRHGAALLAQLLRGHSHAQSSTDRGTGVAHTKGVVLTLRALGKTRQAIFLTDAKHLLTTAGEYLMGIGLVAHVPDQAIIGRVENIV